MAYGSLETKSLPQMKEKVGLAIRSLKEAVKGVKISPLTQRQIT